MTSFFKRASRTTRRSDAPTARRRQGDADGGGEHTSSDGQQHFKRNQTLSSYRQASTDDSPRQKVHQLTTQRRRLGGIFLIVAAAVIFLLFLLWQLIAQVQVTTSTRQLTAPFEAARYEAAVNDYLGLNPAQRLRFVLDEPALSEFVGALHPEVEALAYSGMPSLASGAFSVTFRVPVAGWQMNGQQQYVDANGVVFEKNYYETPTVQIVDESGVNTEQGSAVVGSRLLGFLGKVVAQAEGRGYTVVKAVLPSDTTRTLDVYFDGIPTRIRLTVDRGAGEQVEDADRSLRYLRSRGATPEHIDVRVPGRAAYR